MTSGALTELLAAWLPRQRWFAGSGIAVRQIAVTSQTTLASGDPELRHLIVAVSVGADVVSYQVLVGYRAELPASLAQAVVGMVDGRVVYDALSDPQLTAVLVRGIAEQRVAGPLRFTAVPGAAIDQRATSRTLPAEQSNTSVVLGDQAILKVLRRPHEGRHPDLEVPRALARGGSKLVAAPLGWIEMTGALDATDPDRLAEAGQAVSDSPAPHVRQTAHPDQVAQPNQVAPPGRTPHPDPAGHPDHPAPPGRTPHPDPAAWSDRVARSDRTDREGAAGAGEAAVLAILSRYYPGASDGWSLALASLGKPEPDFTGQARLLGQATARLHGELARAFGTVRLARQALSDLADMMSAELDLAVAEVPELRPYRDSIRACYTSLARLSDQVVAQRIHGDYHLGQVLGTDGGWVVLDFEGEPSVPLALRRAYAPALRDVAGMLRSFDYAARHQLQHAPADQRLQASVLDWAERCSDAFCSGYAEAGGADPRDSGPLLRALVFQKSVYEAVYEARHRPGWLPIPLAAIAKAAQ